MMEGAHHPVPLHVQKVSPDSIHIATFHLLAADSQLFELLLGNMHHLLVLRAERVERQR